MVGAASPAQAQRVREFYHPNRGDQALPRRKPSAQKVPWRDYVGHNPLFAMADFWRQSGGQPDK